MSINSIEALVLDLIGEDAEHPDVFTDTTAGMVPLRDSINAGIQEIAALTGSYRKTFHLMLHNGRQFYRITTNEDHFVHAEIVHDRGRHRKLEQTSLYTLSRRDPWFMQRTGAPRSYCHVGTDTIGLYPAPDSDGNVLEIRATFVPAAYTTGDDAIQLREAWQRAAAYLAVSEFYASRGDAGRAKEYLAEYLELAQLKFTWPAVADRSDGRIQGQPTAA